MATKIKLTCKACQGDVLYEYDGPRSQESAHSRLHAASCPFTTAESRIWYVAEHGQPVESEAAGSAAEVVPA